MQDRLAELRSTVSNSEDLIRSLINNSNLGMFELKQNLAKLCDNDLYFQVS